METSVLHHAEICVGEETSILHLLQIGLGFRLSHFRSSSFAYQWVLTSGRSTFIVTRRRQGDVQPNANFFGNNKSAGTEENVRNIANAEPSIRSSKTENFPNQIEASGVYPFLFCRCVHESHSIDSVFNVALEVVDVDAVTSRIISRGGTVLHEPFSISDDQGTLRLAVVASECENIIHTLLDKSKYKGSFLPGFKSIEYYKGRELTADTNHNIKVNGTTDTNGTESKGVLTNYIDHVTYVCRAGESQRIIQWYEDCFHMKRFMANNQETVEDGFVLGDGIGLRMKALQFWRCAETGIASIANPNHWSVLRIVVGEPLPDAENSHVSAFLRENSGPGVQHIGLHCDNILRVVTTMEKRGVRFRMPPPTYYEECPKLKEIVEGQLRTQFSDFRKSGILLDVEEDLLNSRRERYLMQIFTHPIFDKDTFFFEVIQRCGATGFGAGNISALAKSIVRYQEEMKNQLEIKQTTHEQREENISSIPQEKKFISKL